jgi:hypothetical protein
MLLGFPEDETEGGGCGHGDSALILNLVEVTTETIISNGTGFENS